ncbi:serine/threonine protein kinase [Micromonospora sp. R77]|uniref:serine/threonine-protein kinase n=1 Tax=Micromonospora sp. R77 TaxID=2925836 RepID=UPI001F61E574|nr:serine/threonine-protein kinase [Micromonospora sp. R77]MCI4061890.1 serine/threonine protein kinase [Micromonospora sp. R77]
MLTPGVLLHDRYLLGERIATGGMGAVWRCTDTLLDRPVAVKVLLPALVADPEFTTRFRAEARMLAALRHPGIVQVHDVGSATLPDGSRVSYLVMEYVDGEPLVTRVRRTGRLDPAATMSVVAQAARALHAAHVAGIVHRDVKPGNLLVERDGSVVLVDFGIARSGTTAGITAAHTVLGTASYMSPEQAGGQPVSPATDVYALGAVAYYCLSGRPPFEGENPLQVALRQVQDEPAPLPPGTPPAVAEVVRRALAKSPGDRYASAAALSGRRRGRPGRDPGGAAGAHRPGRSRRTAARGGDGSSRSPRAASSCCSRWAPPPPWRPCTPRWPTTRRSDRPRRPVRRRPPRRDRPDRRPPRGRRRRRRVVPGGPVGRRRWLRWRTRRPPRRRPGPAGGAVSASPTPTATGGADPNPYAATRVCGGNTG